MSFAEPSRIEPDNHKPTSIALAILFLPLTLPLLLFLCLFIFLPVGIFVFLSGLTGELLFYLSMWNDGRTLSRRQLDRRLATGETGTLIIEYPTMGFQFSHVWWTLDDLPALAPEYGPTTEEYHDQVIDLMDQDLAHPWDEWCWRKYTSTWQGSASLLRVWGGKRYRNWLEKHFPLVPIVETWSAVAHQLELEAQQETHR